MQAREFMVDALIVVPDRSVRDLAKLLLDENSDGACVVEHGRLVGVVTTMDLVFQEKKVHLPSILSFMDFAIPLEPPDRLRQELEKIAGTRVREIMSTDLVTVGPDATMSEVASLMVDKHLTLVPVVEGERVLGVINKQSLLRATL
ncbi:MAG: CBS domain-containing protein [Myxococcales bacterium]|nr:CBS domain-containing protein [Myxococcales bacterium]